MTLETPPASAPPAGDAVPGTVAKRSSSPGRERTGVVVQVPGRVAGSWSRWLFPTEGAAFPLSSEDSLPEKAPLFTALPSAALFVWPLWIAPEGDTVELARMELSGRHLLKRGMEDSLSVQVLDARGDRRLVLAIATEEPFPSDLMPSGWLGSEGFGIPMELLGPGPGRDAAAPHGNHRSQGGAPACELLLWKEHGVLHAGLRRDGKAVWFSRVSVPGLGGLLRRIVLRLSSEGTIPGMPSRILLAALDPEEERDCRPVVRELFPRAEISLAASEAPPLLPAARIAPGGGGEVPAGSDLAPAEAKAFRLGKKQRERLLLAGWIVGLLYLFLLLWGAGDLMIRHAALAKLRRQVSDMKTPAAEAHRLSDRWNALRPAVDPSTYPLDILAAIAAPTQGGKVRLISVIMESGHLQIAGEATDVTQAYGFMEALKKTPLLQQFDWTTGQPQLAGKESVKFEMEGSRPHANP